MMELKANRRIANVRKYWVQSPKCDTRDCWVRTTPSMFSAPGT
jgi:hypothetical protein